jgi:hypothetical protein
MRGGPANLTARGRSPPTTLGLGPFFAHIAHRGAPVLEAFFSALLVLVCIGVIGFAALTVKKLYQGQR